MAKFPTPEWVDVLVEKLNADTRYAEIARKWEGDMIFTVEPAGNLTEKITYYLDLWHGKCRSGTVLAPDSDKKAFLVLRVPYENGIRLLKGELDPMAALLTRRVSVQGNMAVLMRKVPTVLDFVRCCREVTDSFI